MDHVTSCNIFFTCACAWLFDYMDTRIFHLKKYYFCVSKALSNCWEPKVNFLLIEQYNTKTKPEIRQSFKNMLRAIQGWYFLKTNNTRVYTYNRSETIPKTQFYSINPAKHSKLFVVISEIYITHEAYWHFMYSKVLKFTRNKNLCYNFWNKICQYLSFFIYLWILPLFWRLFFQSMCL